MPSARRLTRRPPNTKAANAIAMSFTTTSPALLPAFPGLAAVQQAIEEAQEKNASSRRDGRRSQLLQGICLAITFFLLLLDPVSGEIEYTNAGHNPGLLLHPDGSIEELGRELGQIATGRSELAPAAKDRRFADEAWRTIPSFRMLGQSYRLLELWMNRVQESVDGSWQEKARARFAADVISAALSPTNYLGTNPAALREAVATGGLSLGRGAQNMLRDMARGGMPSMVDRKQFKVGKDLAATPGAVVYRDEMFELLQYAPTTPKVRTIPVLMFPPQINRHYILDLSPGRSLVEFAVSQGIQVFMVVWRNPSGLRGDGKWGLDDYIAAPERAADVVKKIARTEKINLLGLCAGGITVSYVLAHLAAIELDTLRVKGRAQPTRVSSVRPPPEPPSSSGPRCSSSFTTAPAWPASKPSPRQSI